MMMKGRWNMRKLFALTVCLILGAAASIATAHAQANRPLKVALILNGSVTDGTFNAAAAKAGKAAQAKFPNISVSIRENTALAQTEQAVVDYIRDGYDVVVGYGFQFAEVAERIHDQYPKVWFIANTARVAAPPNLASFDNRWPEAGYVAGAVASLLTKSGAVGTVGAIPIPAIVEYNDGFEKGAKYIKPDVRLLSAMVGSFSDVAKAKEITLGLIEQGADVVTATGNESVIGTVEAAKQKGALMIGTFFDTAAFAPDTIVTTIVVDFDLPLVTAIQQILDGKLEPKIQLLGFGDGGLRLAGYGKFDAKIGEAQKKRIIQLIANIKDGRVADMPKFRY